MRTLLEQLVRTKGTIVQTKPRTKKQDFNDCLEFNIVGTLALGLDRYVSSRYRCGNVSTTTA